MKKVYLASPYTKGDVAENVKMQLDTGDILMNNGYAVFLPLLSHFQHMAHPRPYQDWIKHDLEWIKSCDCLLRLGGESEGADMEVAYAKKLGIPVFFSIFQLYDYDWDGKKISARPPIGLKPKAIHDDERLSEVWGAIVRRVKAERSVPDKWIHEFVSLYKKRL